MARLVLHIGTHKTATTTVQDTFHNNRTLLAEQGVVYPDLGRHSGHHGLLTDWISLPAAYELSGGGINNLRALAKEYVDKDVTLFLSSEEMSRGGGAGGKVDMQALAQIFAGFESVKILCFLRSQWQFLQSVYLEIARTRIPPPPHQIVAEALETGMVDGLWCNYSSLYDHLLTGFDAGDILFMDFDTARNNKGGIIRVVLETLGIPLDINRLSLINDGLSNVSAAPLPTWAALAIAGGNMVNADLSEAVQTAFDLEFGPGAPNCLFTRKELENINNWAALKNAELLQHIADTSGMQSNLLAKLPENTIFREDINSPFWVRAARRIFLASRQTA